MKRSLCFALSVAALYLAAAASWADVRPSAAGNATTKAKPASTAMASSQYVHHPMSKATTRHRWVNLNSASKRQLMRLPGVGEVIANKIIDARPFKTRTELLSKHIISRKEYLKIRNSVTARQTT